MQKTAESGGMLKEERQRRILEILGREGKVLAAELSETLDVSEDTIRRDLRELAAAHRLQRVHGGALPRSPVEPSYAVRQRLAVGAKRAVAHAVLPLLQSGQVIIMDGSTTTQIVAESLPRDLRATVITNSPPIAGTLAGYEGLDVVVLGGQLQRESLVTIGAAVIEALRFYRADLCLLGIGALHPEIGISVLDHEEAHVKRAMIASAGEVVGLVSAEKLGTALPFVVAPAASLTHLVTDAGASPDLLAAYRDRGITVLMGGGR